VYSQLGNDTPDVDVSSLKAMYNTTQSLIADDKISAGHDISDGGIAVTLLEAAFAGNCGIQVPAYIKPFYHYCCYHYCHYCYYYVILVLFLLLLLCYISIFIIYYYYYYHHCCCHYCYYHDY